MNILINGDGIKIIDSYKITSIKDMLFIIEWLKYNYEFNDVLNSRTKFSLINEWRAHNLLYNIYILRKHTKDVDFNKQSIFISMLYFILSIFYFKL